MMKTLQNATIILFIAVSIFAQDPTPIWELGKTQISPEMTKGKVELVNGGMKLDGLNGFQIPASVLGVLTDYTVEFEFRRSPKFQNFPRMFGGLSILSNTDFNDHTGFTLIYLPPKWDPNGGVSNRIGIDINGYWNGEIAGLAGNEFNKISFVVKDGMASIYRNGLLIAMTGEVKQSRLPLVVGGFGGRGSQRYKKDVDKPFPEPYEFRKLKIFAEAITPKGYDGSTNMMRNVGGEGYQIQRAVIKDKSLPRILVIGDSISMGYRSLIAEHYKGKAYVDYWVGGGVPWGKGKMTADSKTAKSWEGVLSNGPYDVVSWNPMTLHWWHRLILSRCPNGEILARNLTDTVKFLKQAAPKTQFIWIRCTPIRKCLEDGSHVLDDAPNCNSRIVKYNKISDGVMQKEGIPEVDLYAIAEKQLHTVKKGSKDIVHWNRDVSRLFANAIIKEIDTFLSEKK
jgi:hypothetical protein